MTNAYRRSQSGFTLAETLIAMLLMSFVGLIVTGGIAMGARVYGRIVERSNAELLLSTTLLELRDQLDRVNEVQLSGTTLASYRESTSNWKKLVKKTESFTVGTQEGGGTNVTYPPGIYVSEYKGYSVTGASSDTLYENQPLVTDEAAGQTLYATYDDITYDSANRRFVITGLRVCKKGTTTALAWLDRSKPEAQAHSCKYYIRPLEDIRQYS